MNIKLALRTTAAVALVAGAMLLAGCSGLGANTGSVTLTVYNGNSTSGGTYVYKNVYVDNKILVATDIQAGQLATVKVDPGQHYMSYTFEVTPNGGATQTYSHNSGSGNDTFTIPVGSTTYSWYGPVLPQT